MLVENDSHEVSVMKTTIRTDPDVLVMDGVRTFEARRMLSDARMTGHQVIFTTDACSADETRRDHRAIFGMAPSPSYGGDLVVHLSLDPTPHLEFVTPVSFTPTREQLAAIEEGQWSKDGRVNPWRLSDALTDACLPHLLAGEALENALRLRGEFDGTFEELLEVAGALTF
jgi:hypothetical protein